MSKTVHRIIELISELNLSARQFDMSIGTANGYILRMKKNNASVGSDIIERIIKVYPKVNLVWLITGEGNMFISTPEDDLNEEQTRSIKEIKSYINIHLRARLSDEKKVLLDLIYKDLED